jgi:hypothetical protein
METGRKKKVKIGCLVAALVVFGGGYWFYGPILRHFLPTAWDSLFPASKQTYHGDSTANLQAMRTALLGYEESEGQFPAAAGWMDAIGNRLNTDNLKKGEGLKKLVTPEFVGQEGKYGYAFNDALSGKYHGDIKDQKTPMIFESSSTEKNAHGDPSKLRKPGGVAITVDGQIVK